MESVGVGTRVAVVAGRSTVVAMAGKELGTAEDVAHPAKNRRNTIAFIICHINLEPFILAPFHTTACRLLIFTIIPAR